MWEVADQLALLASRLSISCKPALLPGGLYFQGCGFFFPVRSCRSSVWCSTATAALQTEPVISCVLSISRTKQQVFLASFNCSDSMKGIFYQGAAVSSSQAAKRGDKLVWEYCSNSNLAGECSCLLNWLSYWKHMKLCFDSTSRHSISDSCYSWNI